MTYLLNLEKFWKFHPLTKFGGSEKWLSSIFLNFAYFCWNFDKLLKVIESYGHCGWLWTTLGRNLVEIWVEIFKKKKNRKKSYLWSEILEKKFFVATLEKFVTQLSTLSRKKKFFFFFKLLMEIFENFENFWKIWQICTFYTNSTCSYITRMFIYMFISIFFSFLLL